MPKYNFDTAVRGAIRRAFARSDKVRTVLSQGRREVPKYKKDGSRAKRDSVQYLCQVCNTWVSSTKIQVDHIIPVVSVEEGFIDFNTFAKRVDCPIENLQRICKECHLKKTTLERDKRILIKDKELLFSIELSLLSGNILKEYKKILKRLSKKDKPIFKEVKEKSEELLNKYFSKKL